MSDEQKPIDIITKPLQPDTGRYAQIGTDIPFREPAKEPPKKDEPKNEKPAKEEPRKETPPAQNNHFDVDAGGTVKVPIQQP